ncbi:VOC family protein [Egibacter rhizosphaerae]|uniref:VOC family protein n=1 Tax=Egibacter rhizosphaerae TaxID=1670831 RepID=UPI0013F1465F|nr:VOC family protein [Egibacter rhizosphaerae]
MPITSVIDHVAAAVPDPRVASQRWVDELGGGTLNDASGEHFATRQIRYTGGGKLELLAPPPDDDSPDNFVRRFLDRRGAGVHHVTLKVPELHPALREMQAAGYEVVDVQDTHPHWWEGFMRPSQVGGLIVQVAQSSLSAEEWAAQFGRIPEAPHREAAELRGPLLAHPDLGVARELWGLLGGDVRDEGDRLLVAWPDSVLTVAIVHGKSAGPRGLRFAGSGTLPPDNAAGPAVLEESARDRG